MPYKLFPRAALAFCLFLTLAPAAPAQERSAEQFQIAIGLLQRELPKEAAGYFQSFLQAQPRHPLAREAWYRLGTCQADLGEREDAVASLRRALEGSDSFALLAECQYRLGHVLKELGQFDVALEQFADLVEDVAADHYLLAASLYAAGECLRDMGEDEEALRAFLAAAESATGDSASFAFPSLYQAGFAQIRENIFRDASATFQQAAAVAPDRAARGECQFLAGDAALRGGQLDQAEQAFRTALEIQGDHRDDALMGLAWVGVEREDLQAGMQRFAELISQHGDSSLVPKARLEVGRLHYRQGSYPEAVRELEDLLEDRRLVGEDRGAALELRGLALLETGNAEDAERSFTAAMELSGGPQSQARLRYNMAEAFAEKARWEDALSAYSQVRGDGVDEALYGDALYGESLALHRLHRYQESQARAETLLADLSGHRLAVQARFAVAENLFALKRYADAERSYAQVDSEHQLFGRAEFKRAWCVYLAGDKRAAAARFAAIAEAGEATFREEALSMQALSLLEAGQNEEAKAVADTYAGRYQEGTYLARTERVAARVLRAEGDLRGAAARMARAAQAAASEDAGGDLLEQAELVFQNGDFTGAQKIYQQLVERTDRVGAQALEGLAWCAFELGDDAECQELLTRGMAHEAIGDGVAGLLELEGALHHRAENWAAAEATAKRFLAEFPDHDKTHEVSYALGVAQARGGNHGRARQTLTELLRVERLPRRDRVQYELAWASRRDGDEEAALAAFAEVAKSRDADLAGEALLHMGTAALEAERVEAGRAHLRSVEGRFRARALYRIGFSYLQEEEYAPAEQAFAAIETMGDGEPLYLEAVFLVGECQLNRDQHADAAPRFALLLERDPDHDRAATSRLKLGECAVVLGRPDDAVIQLEAFLHGGPPEPEQARANLWLGKARMARGEHERAQEALHKVTELSDGELAAEAQYRIGESRRLDGELQDAADAFVVLSILYAHDKWVCKGLLAAGQCFEQLEEPDKAKRFYQELLTRFPNAQESREAKARLGGL